MRQSDMSTGAEKPECLSEQLLCNASRRLPRPAPARSLRRDRRANASRIPAHFRPGRLWRASIAQARHAPLRPCARRRRAPVPCRRSQAHPPFRFPPAAAPGSTSPAERGENRRETSPISSSALPQASQAATRRDARWGGGGGGATRSPRRASTRTGLRHGATSNSIAAFAGLDSRLRR